MAKRVVENFKELYHYTNAEGLHGIITSQYLRATNISFLNDAEERIHYFDKRLPIVIKQTVQAWLDENAEISEWQGRIKGYGGYENALEAICEELNGAIRQLAVSIDEPYVISLCGAKDESVARDGLLSQWRGYGGNGGYAIVFDSEALDSLVRSELGKYLYTSLHFGGVNYYDGKNSAIVMSDDARGDEEVLRHSITAYLGTFDEKKLLPIYDSIGSLSCSTKHYGFHEENEVRIVALRWKSNKNAREDGDNRPERDVHHVSRGGGLLPYICLFQEEPLNNHLPIKSIIVGPHPDKEKRKKAVEVLLEQHGISAKVTVSDIPYLPG